MTDMAKSPVPNDKDAAKPNDPVLEASLESFPASDAPGWIAVRVGSAAPLQAKSAPLKRPRKRDTGSTKQ